LEHYFVRGVVHDNGAIGSERTGAALLEESFVCLVILVRERRKLQKGNIVPVAYTSRGYYMRYH
jgi:hypothetical protein